MTPNEPGATAAPVDAEAGDDLTVQGGAACLNCGAVLPGPTPRFCAHCGQDTRLRAPTVGESVRQFADQYIAADGSLWRTLRLLLTRPGALTSEYLAGRRRHYVLPLRLYLTVSVLVLLGVGALLDARLADVRPLVIDVPRSHFVFIDAGVLRVGVDQGRFYCERVPAALCDRLQQHLMADPSAMWQRATAAAETTVGKLGAAMFVLQPVFALLLRLAFAGRPCRFAEHLVFSLHVHSFWFLAVGLASLGLPGLTQAAALAIPVYSVLAARQVYGGRWWALALRLAALGAAYTVLLGAALTALTLWALLQ